MANQLRVVLRCTKISQEALCIITELNDSYHTPEEIQKLISELTGQDIDENFAMFSHFYSDCGKNIHIGKYVFVNAGCKFQA